MHIILDTDKKTMPLPWNYREKLEAYNNMVMEISGDASKKKDFESFVNVVRVECMENSDKCLKTANKSQKPAAGITADDMNAVAVNKFPVDLGFRVLVAADDDCIAVLPQNQVVSLQPVGLDMFFKGQIVGRAGGPGFQIINSHSAPPFCSLQIG